MAYILNILSKIIFRKIEIINDLLEIWVIFKYIKHSSHLEIKVYEYYILSSISKIACYNLSLKVLK